MEKKGEKIWNVPRSFVFLAPDPPAKGISRQAFSVCGGGWWITLLMFACSVARPSVLFPMILVNLPTVTMVFALWACDYIPRTSQIQVSTSCFNNTHLLSAEITTLHSLFVFTCIPPNTTVSFLSHFLSSVHTSSCLHYPLYRAAVLSVRPESRISGFWSLCQFSSFF